MDFSSEKKPSVALLPGALEQVHGEYWSFCQYRACADPPRAWPLLKELKKNTKDEATASVRGVWGIVLIKPTRDMFSCISITDPELVQG